MENITIEIDQATANRMQWTELRLTDDVDEEPPEVSCWPLTDEHRVAVGERLTFTVPCEQCHGYGETWRQFDGQVQADQCINCSSKGRVPVLTVTLTDVVPVVDEIPEAYYGPEWDGALEYDDGRDLPVDLPWEGAAVCVFWNPDTIDPRD